MRPEPILVNQGPGWPPIFLIHGEVRSAAPDAQEVTWSSPASEQMDEIDRIIAEAR